MALAQSEIFEDEFPLVRSCPALNEIRLAEQIKDLTIEVQDGAVLQAHRIILAARIPCLRESLIGLHREQNPLLRWPTVPLRVNFENLATTWDFASSFKIDLLTEKCLSLMRQRFEEFVATELFLRMPADTVLTLLRSDDLSVESEEQVIGAISHWVCSGDKADDEKLKVHAPAMLKEVQWHQTTFECRSLLMERYPIFQKSLECPGSARFCSCLQLVHLFFFSPRTIRRGKENVFVVGGDVSGEVSYSQCVVEFLVKEVHWCERAPLTIGRRFHAAAVVKTVGGGEGTTLLGVFGGENVEGRLSSCEVYDVNRDRWFNLPDMWVKRIGPAAACLSGDYRVFVFGGCDDTSYLTSVEFCRLEADWEEATDTAFTEDFWQAAAPMITARSDLAATPFRGRIIVAGGVDDGGGRLNVVEMFTPPDASSPLGQWTELTCMNQRRAFFSLLTSADAVFALGGDDWGMHYCPPLAMHSFSLTLLHEAHFMRQKACSIC
ncbi:unnamed protein product [Schistocephalus solidus]|uniref:BTB domain-containing protein n=1 Tax=Schistocephalus solidus TaxID=70667 RepID=A0A183TQK1_SCHSO|nr:unnamed protein product [Schistocephalus solidus]